MVLVRVPRQEVVRPSVQKLRLKKKLMVKKVVKKNVRDFVKKKKKRK